MYIKTSFSNNPLNIAVTEHLISYLKYESKTALYRQVAIDILLEDHKSNFSIKLILMDYQIPLMNRYKTIRVLRKLIDGKRVAKVPIIALKAQDSEDDREMFIKTAMSDHLNKPLKEARIIKMINKYIRK